jgi:DNA-binding transcriptional LysR family regulator
LKIHYLAEFLAVVNLKNFSDAADELYISQSALSKHIASLEQEFGYKLFDRTTRNIELTPHGEELVPYAKQIMDIYYLSILSIKDVVKNKNEIVKIASIPVMPHYDITKLIVLFKSNYPNVPYNITEHDSSNISNLFRNKSIDLAFTRTRNLDQSFECITYNIDELVLVVPENHQYANNKTIHISMLKNEDFLLLHENTSIYDLSIEACNKANFTPKVTYTGHRIENIIDMIERGVGVSLLMKKHVEYYKNNKVKIIKLHPTTTSNISLCKLNYTTLSHNAQLFWDFVSNYLKEIK